MINWTNREFRRTMLVLALLVIGNLVAVFGIHMAILAAQSAGPVTFRALYDTIAGNDLRFRIDLLIVGALVVVEMVAAALIRAKLHGED